MYDICENEIVYRFLNFLNFEKEKSVPASLILPKISCTMYRLPRLNQLPLRLVLINFL